jgi:branched-chain amino acid transport system substrate-binding protein
MVDHTRRQLGLAALSLPLLAAAPALRAQTGPIRIGSTLGLTGPLSGASAAQKIASDIFMEGLNKRGGLLGRPVEWIVRDDQSKPDVARTLYEQLITVDKVDLLMGPYATGAILSAMGVAQRYNKVLIHNTFGLPGLAKYDGQFSVSGSAFDIESVWPSLVLDAAASAAPAQNHCRAGQQVPLGALCHPRGAASHQVTRSE